MRKKSCAISKTKPPALLHREVHPMRSAFPGTAPGWYPTDVLEVDKGLLILNGKGHGSHANPDGPTPGKGIQRPLGYDLGQLNGTLRFVSADLSPARLAQDSR